MPLKLNVGLTKKIGQRDYGSLGASCHVELELDQSLIVSDLDGFQERVRRAFGVCRQAVDDELTRHRPAANKPNGAAPHDHSGDANGNSRSARRNGNGQRASEKQIDYARQLAGQVKGLGLRRLETLAGKMFDRPLADLSSLDASGLIDVLKDIKAGKIQLGDALNGAAA